MNPPPSNAIGLRRPMGTGFGPQHGRRDNGEPPAPTRRIAG